MKFLKISIVIFIVCAIVLLIKLTIFYSTTQNQIIWDATTTQKVIELPDAPYDCKILKAVIGDDVEFCKLKIARPIVFGQPMVMGDFNRLTNRIRITKETNNSSIAHELKHYAISCTRKTGDEELCVRSAQKMELELDLIKS